MADTQLQVGEQARAAKTILDALSPIADALTQLSRVVEDNVDGFRGEAANAFGEALEAWFKAAGTLPPTMIEFANKLVETDKAAGTTDATQQSRYAKRLGGL